MKQLSLIKSEHQYVFRYHCGKEKDLINALSAAAISSETDFDWFDAAVLSFQSGIKDTKVLIKEIEREI